jgi:hypothetical protein
MFSKWSKNQYLLSSSVFLKNFLMFFKNKEDFLWQHWVVSWQRWVRPPTTFKKIPAGELIDKVGIAKELQEWPDMTAEEKMQRKCDIRRIVKRLFRML